MKVLLLGKSGMLGSYFLKHLAGDQDFEMYAFNRKNLDISSFKDLEKVFKKISPNLVINCAAYTKVDDCEKYVDEAFKINSRAAGVIAKVCNQENATLIHFSTDYVFDGENQNGYDENSDPNPINVYGHSKLGGENFIKAYTDDYYIIRTSWLYGKGGKNFVDTMMQLATKKKSLDIVNDQIGSPTYANDLVRNIIAYFLEPFLTGVERHHPLSIEKESKEEKHKLPYGTYHLSNSGQTSWADFAKKIFEFSKIKLKVKTISSEEYKTAAKRPAFSVLNNTKLPKIMRPWEDGLEAYLKLHF